MGSVTQPSLPHSHHGGKWPLRSMVKGRPGATMNQRAPLPAHPGQGLEGWGRRGSACCLSPGEARALLCQSMDLAAGPGLPLWPSSCVWVQSRLPSWPRLGSGRRGGGRTSGKEQGTHFWIQNSFPSLVSNWAFTLWTQELQVAWRRAMCPLKCETLTLLSWGSMVLCLWGQWWCHPGPPSWC